MRYNSEIERIEISVNELAELARRGICPTLPRDEDTPTLGEAGRALRLEAGADKPRPLSLDFEAGGYAYRLTGVADAVTDEGLSVMISVDSAPERVSKEVEKTARARAFLLGRMLAEISPKKKLSLSVIYASESEGRFLTVSEWVSRDKLDKFFLRCVTSVGVYARPEAERVTLRLPSMRGLRFPYERARDGQGIMVKSVYRCLSRGNTLIACAPTGTGKTVSALYPAIRALGDGRCDKIFYLTPKTTTAAAACDCIRLMCEEGAIIRAVHLGAKDKCCIGGHKCRTDRRLCRFSACNRLPDAVMELYDRNEAVMSVDTVRQVAEAYGICPYELELTYSELCDAVICDINYLFDPKVYIRRFFNEGGRFGFLIDEAHNLPERAREMYSAEISESELSLFAADPLLSPLSPFKGALDEATVRLREILLPYLRDELREDKNGKKTGATHLSEPPTPLFELFGKLEESADEELRSAMMARDGESGARLSFLRDILYKIKQVNLCLSLFDDGYRLFLFYEDGGIRMKLFCLDTGRVIRTATDKGHGAVFFSATLTPLDYYRELLGADRDSELLEVRSPFDPSQLSVSIMDKISTRYSERHRTLPAVCQAIAATLSARRGNYMIFSPSFEYSEALAEEFSRKYPKIRTLSQRRDMTPSERSDFLREFEKDSPGYLVGFCVMGGIYSEGVDLVGKSLIGAVVVGIGIPALSYGREAMAEYYADKYEKGKEYAYIFPGMRRVLQAAGRVIRRESDRGVIVLIDDRFDDPIYKKVIPELWEGMKFVSDPHALRERIDKFWLECDKEQSEARENE